MASMWRRAMLYLGLGPDDEYDDYEPYDDRMPSRPCARAAAAARWHVHRAAEPSTPSAAVPACAR